MASATSGNQPNQLGAEDLAWLRGGTETRRLHHDRPVQIAVTPQRISDAHPDADPRLRDVPIDVLPTTERLLDADRCIDGVRRSGERGH